MITNVNLESERLGETGYNKYNSLMTIIKYNNTHNIIVEFKRNNNRVTTNYNSFLKGGVKNPYDKTVFGIGYLGEGKYVKSVNRVHTKIYSVWLDMIKRVYSTSYQEKHLTYRDCVVCDEWHNFQNFGKWYDENYYKVEDWNMQLDKDILIKGNKVYSPDTCIFVPQNINLLFVKNNIRRGNYPIGVCLNKVNNKFGTYFNNENSYLIFLGFHKTPELAFDTYKKYKENLIKNIADRYINSIPQILYDAMYKYEVEITD